MRTSQNGLLHHTPTVLFPIPNRQSVGLDFFTFHFRLKVAIEVFRPALQRLFGIGRNHQLRIALIKGSALNSQKIL